MKLLVLGGTGQVGSELINEGEKQGLVVVAPARVELDICQQNAVNEFIQLESPDMVINAAAYTAVDKAESEPELAYAINCDAAANLARACAELKIPLLHLSTDYVFDGKKELAYTESDNPNPQSIYGKSKMEGERAIASILKQYLILRVSWVFGVNGNNFVKTMLHLATERDVLKIVSDQQGGPTPALAIAKTLINIARRWADGESIPWGTYHYSGQPVTTWRAFAEAIFQQAEKLGMLDRRPIVESITTEDYPTPAKRPRNSMLDCRNTAQQLNIKQPDWQDDLGLVLESWKHQ